MLPHKGEVSCLHCTVQSNHSAIMNILPLKSHHMTRVCRATHVLRNFTTCGRRQPPSVLHPSARRDTQQLPCQSYTPARVLRCYSRQARGEHHEQNGLSSVPWLASLDVWHSQSATTASQNGNSNGNGVHNGQTPQTGRHASAVTEIPTDLDAILVLAGGLTPEGDCPPWAQRRLDTAAGLFAAQARNSSRKRPCPILCLGGGTPHKPPVLADDGYVIHESTSCAAYLIQKHNVPAHHILKETSSYDTVGNAYFGLTIHALPAGWRHVAVVTSAFHMPRSRSLFTAIWARAARDVCQDPHRYTLWFAAASDAGLWTEDVLQARIAKEAASQAAWETTVSDLPAFTDLHSWLYRTHQCYAVPRQHEANRTTIKDPKLLASY